MKKTIIIILLSAFSLFAEDIKQLSIGAKAPDFNLPGIDGKNYSLKSFSTAKVLVIIFTCTHCPTAQAYEERIKQLYADYSTKNVAIVAISPNDPKAVRPDELGYTEYSDTFEEMKLRGKEKNFVFPYLYDGETQATSRLYGSAATPHVFIFDKDRKLQFNGRIDDSENPASVNVKDTRNAIDELLAGKPVSVSVTKTYGCSTKWSDKRSSVQKFYENCAKEELTIESIDEVALKALVKNGSQRYRLINVWATWCGSCISEMSDLIYTGWMFRNREFDFITISSDKLDKADKAKEILKQKMASGKHYIFSSTDKYKLIEAIDKNWQGALPYSILVAPNGQIVFRSQGEVNPIELRKAIVEKLGRYFF
jgi:peroxiredoxin